MADPIEVYYSTQAALIACLRAANEESFAQEASDNLQRTLVLAIASFFEHEITELMRDATREHSGGSSIISAIVEQKAIKRQYHTYFNWELRNANSFFALFGEDFRDRAKAHVTANAALDEGIRAFLDLGNTRNLLVHLNFLTYSIEKVPEELIALYRKARLFIEFLRTELIPRAAETTTTASAIDSSTQVNGS